MRDAQAEWARILYAMVERRRRDSPNDARTDEEMAESLLDHFVRRGLVKMRRGKYVLPLIDDPKAMLRLLREDIS